jgi:hypothetical protein
VKLFPRLFWPAETKVLPIPGINSDAVSILSSGRYQIMELVPYECNVQAALVIRGLFICEIDYSRSIKIHQTSAFEVFPSHIHDFNANMHKNCKKWSFYAIQCSLVIRGFIIRGSYVSTANYEVNLYFIIWPIRTVITHPVTNRCFNRHKMTISKLLCSSVRNWGHHEMSLIENIKALIFYIFFSISCPRELGYNGRIPISSFSNEYIKNIKIFVNIFLGNIYLV